MTFLKTSTLLTFSVLANTLLASEISLSSRNMPRSCEFVFEVESDIRLSLPKEIQDSTIVYQFQNSWGAEEWSNEAVGNLTTNTDSKSIELTLQSMSLPEKYLYRRIKIHLPESKMTCFAEFGREFGEACMPEGRSKTPWRKRVIECETFN